MHKRRVVAPQLLAHLADGLHEGQRFDVSHRTANLNDGDVDILRHFLHGRFDFIGDVRDYLDGFTEIIASALLGDDLFIEATGRPVVIARKLRMREAFVVP